MNIAVIFAGGIGSRMNTNIPKQFIKICDKEIIIHTIEKFEKNKEIDAIYVSCKEGWLDFLDELIKKYKISKVKKIVKGGETGQLSIYNGIKVAYQECPEDSIVLIHDGVRPFIDDDLIHRNIESVKENGSAISCVQTIETFIVINEKDKNLEDIPKRSNSMIAKAPQSFKLKDIYDVHEKAIQNGITNSIDSCTLMHQFGKPLSIVMTDYDNIKITTQKDLIIAESIYYNKNK